MPGKDGEKREQEEDCNRIGSALLLLLEATVYVVMVTGEEDQEGSVSVS